MTDASSNPADFTAMVDDDELVFDEPEDVVAAIPEIETAPETEKPRRSPRRGREVVGATEPAAAADAPDLTPSATAPAADAEKPADPPAPVPQPDVGSAGFDRKQTMLLAIVVLALFTSLLSLGGLIAVGRTLAHAEADRARAEDERIAFERMPAMTKMLDDASVRIAQAATRAPGASSPPVTGDDLRHALDDLRLGLSNRQPDGMAPMMGTLHDGFSEMGTRVDHLADEVDQLNKRLSASRPARPAGDRGQPS